MKSELLYRNSVIGICCCIGGDQVQPIRETFLSASVCRVEDVVICTYPSDCGITSQYIGILIVATVRTPNCLFLCGYYFLFIWKWKCSSLIVKHSMCYFHFRCFLKTKWIWHANWSVTLCVPCSFVDIY